MKYAKWRIVEILKTHIGAPTKELEARISDFAPSRLAAPDPHHVTTARQELLTDNEIDAVYVDGTAFYYLPSIEWDDIEPALGVKQRIHADFKGIAESYEKCGKNAEIVTYRALLVSDAWHTPFAPGDSVTHMNGRTTDYGLDLAAYGRKAQYRLGIEVKNIREWIYPESWPVWKTIGSALELNILPILVARRIHYTSFRLFKSIGMIGHETKSQTFSPDLEDHEHDILDAVKENLFYRDIELTDQPKEEQIGFFGRVLPSIAERSQNTFSSLHDLLHRYAIELNLRENSLVNPERSELYHRFMSEL